MKRVLCLIALALTMASANAKRVDVMLITGQTDRHHNWQIMSECMKDVLNEQEMFHTDVVMMTENVEDFNPNFEAYDVVIMNLNNVKWSDEAKAHFEEYMRSGGGLVIAHEANNAFPEWREYNRMIGLGGWGGRNEAAGPYYYLKDGEYVRDTTPGKAGSHGKRVPFQVTVRNAKHPITKGLPSSWMQYDDELYSNLRGPAENIEVLATGFSDSKSGGSGKEEPILLTIRYGKGRIFHTVLGHTKKNFTAAVRENRGFQVSLSRGVEWAASGRVKQKNEIDF